MKTPAYPVVMLVDDNGIDLYLHRRLLQIAGIAERTLEFSNGAAALEFLKNHENNALEIPEVMLLDIQMPLMNGFDFLVHFEQLPAEIKNRVHIFTLSSTNNQEDLWKLRRNPLVKGILRKPLDDGDLLQALIKPEARRESEL
jgi:CheY-like chemotaxis protein